jgi:peptide-methionine (S)-S-oxide reductase
MISFASCAQNDPVQYTKDSINMNVQNSDTATFGAGCFWCVEAIFQQVNGVITVQSGYSGGHVKNPSYREVCDGTTGHAEVCQIVYDPSVVTYLELLEIYWKTHDPTTLNRQGADVGTQYRSVIFYHSEAQKKIAEEMKQELSAAGIWKDPVITGIVPYETFYKAEDYHQDYYFQNASQPYCSAVITPKVEKFKKVFADKIKKSNQER